jgi:hypothetical protein
MRVVRAAAAAALLCAGLAACSSGGVASGSGSGSGSSGSAQVAATSQDVSFTVDGTKTYGTLEIPAHRGGQHLAAALLLAGSGPTDRDGDQPSQKVTPQTLKLVAEELARQGIMTLRFDKYFARPTPRTPSWALSRRPTGSTCWSSGTARAGSTRCWWPTPPRRTRPGWRCSSRRTSGS